MWQMIAIIWVSTLLKNRKQSFNSSLVEIIGHVGFLSCLILCHLSFQFLASSATTALAQIPPAQRINWKPTAAKNQPVHPEWTNAWGSGPKKMVPQQWSAPVAMNYCAKQPRMPNATRMNVLWAAVTLTCVTRARLFPSACSWWPFVVLLAWHYWSKMVCEEPELSLMPMLFVC